MKVALDTNVLASALGTRGLCADVLRAVMLEHDLIISEPVLAELRKNLSKKFRLPAELIAETEALLRAQANVVTDAPAAVAAGIHAADAVILGAAVAGNADVFVTGDAKLIALGARAPLPVISPRQFWALLRRA